MATATEPLLERSEELARIESALAEARAGRGTFVVVEGPAGIGKTALLAAARDAAAEGGMRVLRSRGDGAGARLCLRRGASALRAGRSPRHPSPSGRICCRPRPAWLRACSGFPGAPAQPTLAPSGRRSLVRDPPRPLLAVRESRRAGPLCLVVDDAHWADAPSLRYLAFLLTRLEELDVALVVAARPASREPMPSCSRR